MDLQSLISPARSLYRGHNPHGRHFNVPSLFVHENREKLKRRPGNLLKAAQTEVSNLPLLNLPHTKKHFSQHPLSVILPFIQSDDPNSRSSPCEFEMIYTAYETALTSSYKASTHVLLLIQSEHISNKPCICSADIYRRKTLPLSPETTGMLHVR